MISIIINQWFWSHVFSLDFLTSIQSDHICSSPTEFKSNTTEVLPLTPILA